MSRVKFSIVSLIYKSTGWLEFVRDQVTRHTDLSEGEFFFVANDATDEVIRHLQVSDIPHVIHKNSPEQRKEWYINNVYRAWNTAVREASGEFVILINSDMAFTPGWLDRLFAAWKPGTCVTSRLVERGVLRSGTYGIEKEFGNSYKDYREDEFIDYATSIAEPGCVKDGGLYMPLLIRKEDMLRVGCYPEGNLKKGAPLDSTDYARKGQAIQPGDQVLMAKLARVGVAHQTAFDSIVYHFQMGESRNP